MAVVLLEKESKEDIDADVDAEGTSDCKEDTL